jgi:hypothetical protein
MILQIEQHIKHGQFEQALDLLPKLEETFSNHAEVLWVIRTLQHDLEHHNLNTLNTLKQVKQVLIG